MKKKVRFDKIKIGECFKFYGIIYRKRSGYSNNAVQLTGKSYTNRYFWNDDKVIPVTITIKVKEK